MVEFHGLQRALIDTLFDRWLRWHGTGTGTGTGISSCLVAPDRSPPGLSTATFFSVPLGLAVRYRPARSSRSQLGFHIAAADL